MGNICLLLLTLLVYDPPQTRWPDDLQGAWELKIDWQVNSDSERVQLNNPTTYQIIVFEDQLFLYHKAARQLLAMTCLATKDRDAEEYYFCLARMGEKRKAIKVGANEIVFLSHGTFKSTGFRLNKLNLEETKVLFRTVLNNDALLLNNGVNSETEPLHRKYVHAD
jgi:hypothetical protein